MIDLNKLLILLDAAANCGKRNCEYCKEYFEIGEQCPLWINKDNTENAFHAIMHYMEIPDSTEVTEDEFLMILNGTYDETESKK